ncbi:DUF6355 family natural product biosynthesis protein [Streptomyces sp. NRRL F-2580]|uniref:DUF6355 family natural product biosynthesis protein n=1 Tax=Streptomyces sp. NRRL F-2580 TaxID=1463841 RepID=UPI001F34F0CA|nr:DUF6355 family natural product biosynthesis protein [Streptomyces sp. NRRL F-2580]
MRAGRPADRRRGGGAERHGRNAILRSRGEGRGGERDFYEHCATNANVWIQVKRWPRSNYHRGVGPGRTSLDAGATGAWYGSGCRGGLCSARETPGRDGCGR